MTWIVFLGVAFLVCVLLSVSRACWKMAEDLERIDAMLTHQQRLYQR